MLLKEYIGAGIGLTSVQGNRLIRSADLVPVENFAPENLSDLFHGEIFNRICAVHHH